MSHKLTELQLDPKYKIVIQQILSRCPVPVYAFGSRAKNNAKTFSDLDLCLFGAESLATVRKLQDEFTESDLPFKVDVVVWSELSESFQEQIKNDLFLIHQP